MNVTDELTTPGSDYDVTTEANRAPTTATDVSLQTPRLPEYPDPTRSSSEEDYYFKAAELGIPFALTAAIVVVLCVTVMYTRFRRHRLRQAGASTRPPRTIHGVPLCTAAYGRSLRRPANTSSTSEGGLHGDSVHSNHLAPPSYSGGGGVYSVPLAPPHYYPLHPFPLEQPPKYEDIIKDAPGADRGVQTAGEPGSVGFSISEESTQTPNTIAPNTSNHHIESQPPESSTNENARDNSTNPSPSHNIALDSTRDEITGQTSGHVNGSFENPQEGTSAENTNRDVMGERL